MADRIHPSSKPPAAPSFPPTKGQMYNATRPMYRPQPPSKPRRGRRRTCRGLCRSCCLWLTLLIVALFFLAAIAAGIFYLVYSPQRPSFSLSSIRLSSLNVTSSSLVTSRLALSFTARNPNKKLVYVYDDITVTATSDGATIGVGTVPGFVHEAGNVTRVKAKVASDKESIDPKDAAELKKNGKKRNEKIPLEFQLETRAGVKIGGLKTKKIGINVGCGGATAALPSSKGGKAAAAGETVDCKVKLRIKIWKWNL